MYATASTATAQRSSMYVAPLAFASPRAAAEADPLERLGITAKFEKNRTIYFEGDESAHYYKVRSGTVRLCKVTEDGRRQIAAFLTAGDLFGWTDQDAYNFSAE